MKMTPHQRKQAEERLQPFAGEIACGVVLAFLEVNYFEEYCIPALIDGEGTEINAPGFWFPSDLAEDMGAQPDSLGFIEFEIVDRTEQLDFEKAWDLFDQASKLYVEFHPDRETHVQQKMVAARRTFEVLMSKHQAWQNL